MTRPNRTKRAPNRVPISIAIGAPITAPEAIDTSQIDPQLLGDIDLPPPSPSPSWESSIELLVEPSKEPTKEPVIEPFDYPPIDSDVESSLSNEAPILHPFKGWSIDMEGVLYSTLCTQVELGKRADSGFKKEAWYAVTKAILDAFHVVVSVKQCKSKVDNQKTLWREYNWLKNQSGFGVNEETGLIEAGDGAWADIISVSNLLILLYIYLLYNRRSRNIAGTKLISSNITNILQRYLQYQWLQELLLAPLNPLLQ
jgi:hypothetical protein